MTSWILFTLKETVKHCQLSALLIMPELNISVLSVKANLTLMTTVVLRNSKHILVVFAESRKVVLWSCIFVSFHLALTHGPSQSRARYWKRSAMTHSFCLHRGSDNKRDTLRQKPKGDSCTGKTIKTIFLIKIKKSFI